MDVVADWAWWNGVANLQALRDNGITGAVRYVAYPGSTGKGMTRAEYETLVAAGFSVCWVMETFEQAASRGYGQGLHEGRQAFDWADGIGWPKDRPGYFCAEDPYQISRAAYTGVADYFRAVHDVDPSRPRPGAYGSGALCQYLADLGLISNRWHVSSWAGGREGCTLAQEANGLAGYSTFGGQIDLDSVHATDWGQVPAPFQPAKDDDDMGTFLMWVGQGLHLVQGGRISRQGLEPAQCDSLIAAGVKVVGGPGDGNSSIYDSMRKMDEA